MRKSDLAWMEKVFEREITGGVFQSRSKRLVELERQGLVMRVKKSLGKDRFGEIIVEGYILTIAGNLAYCESCKDVEAAEMETSDDCV